MSEAETLEVVALYNINAASYLAIYMSVTFGYLTVGYFVGAALSSFQANVISIVYVVWSGLMTLGTYANTQAWQAMMASQPTILNTLSIYNSGVLHIAAAIVMVAGVLLSLYFMIDIRNGHRGRAT